MRVIGLMNKTVGIRNTLLLGVVMLVVAGCEKNTLVMSGGTDTVESTAVVTDLVINPEPAFIQRGCLESDEFRIDCPN